MKPSSTPAHSGTNGTSSAREPHLKRTLGLPSVLLFGLA